MQSDSLGLFQILPDNRINVPEVSTLRYIVSVFIYAIDAILVPRYTKLLKFLVHLSSILFVGKVFVPWLSTLVFKAVIKAKI